MASLFYCKQEELELVNYLLERMQLLNLFAFLTTFMSKKCKVIFLLSTKLYGASNSEFARLYLYLLCVVQV